VTTRKVLTAAVLAAVTAIPITAAYGKQPAKGKQLGCTPNVSVMLKGTVASDPAAGATSLVMSVAGSNAHGKSLEGLSVTIALDAKTKVRRQGAKTVESLAMSDRANVQIRRCKADLPLSAATVDDVAARRITAHASKE
jgi:hypothetical protein